MGTIRIIYLGLIIVGIWEYYWTHDTFWENTIKLGLLICVITFIVRILFRKGRVY